MRAAGSSAVGSTLQPSAQLCCIRRHLHSGSAPLCHHLLAYRGAGLLHAPSLRSWAVQPGPGVRCCAASGPSPFGTTGPAPVRRQHKPEWVRILEEDADNDPDVARLLEGTGGDPEAIREKMKFALKETDMRREREGSDVPPTISFRAISPNGLWLWLEFRDEPVLGEREMLEGVLKSWFAVGKLGGYNSQNLQVYENADDDQSFFEYDNDNLTAGESRVASYMHDIGEVEYNGTWARVWIDMGTADELALDVLLNTLLGFSADMVALRSVRLGGQNEDWPLPEEDPDDDYLKVGIDPMKLPEGLDEEFQFMDEEGMLEGGKGRGRAAGPGGASSSSNSSGMSGYGVDAGPYGASASERELQQLAARLRRPEGRAAGGRGAAAGRRRGQRTGSGAGSIYGVDVPVELEDLDPDELAFTEDGEGLDEGQGQGEGQEQQRKLPWGASFVRRVPRGRGQAGQEAAS